MEITDVLICGCGPTGAMLSAYLGRMGIRNVVLEKEADVTTDPRGIALDDDGIRLMQGLGLYDKIFTEIGTCVPRVRFVGGVHHDLHTKPFLCFDTTSTQGNTGHVGLICHRQPVLESHLRSAITHTKVSDLRSSCTLTSVTEDKDHVYASYTDEQGAQRKIRARFMAAADGKTGFTRKNYLEPKGIRLDWAEKTKYRETWVALNWKLHLPTEKTHPDFPLWKLGYSSEAVYDLFFPEEFRFLCNPRRAAVCGRFGIPEERMWRFEFVVGPGEDGAEMSKADKIKEVVFPYITHPGSRYGLTKDVQYPEDCIEVLRCRPFSFSARSCNKWALGRVILCGDSAHVFPPFGGQGIASGFRDVIGLSWRLAILCSAKRRLDHTPILAAWYEERKQQLDRSLATTVRNGDLVTAKSLFVDYVRTWAMSALKLIPSWKTWLELGPRAEGPTAYKHSHGMPFLPQMSGGVSFPQTYCTAMAGQSKVAFTDSVIFGEGKAKLFQIVILLDNISEAEQASVEVSGIDLITSYLSANEATIFVPRLSAGDSPVHDHRVFRSASGDEFAQSALCNKRPPPRGYDELLMWESVARLRYVILRFDRFVYAACSTKAELEHAAKALEDMF